MSKREILTVRFTKDHPYSRLRDTLARIVAQIQRATSTITSVCQFTTDKAHVLNPELFGFFPSFAWHGFQFDNLRTHSDSFEFTNPMQFMKSVIGTFAIMSIQSAFNIVRFTDVAELSIARVA